MASSVVDITENFETTLKLTRRSRGHGKNIQTPHAIENSPTTNAYQSVPNQSTPTRSTSYQSTLTPITIAPETSISPPSITEMGSPQNQNLQMDQARKSLQKKHRNRKNSSRNRPPANVNIYSQSPTTHHHNNHHHQNQTQGTPVRTMHYYAGPTFNSSPAASSLPLPKFFTQSSGLTSENSSGESSENSSSESAGNSPTLQAALRAGNQQIPPREPSPLDIFFEADRREKAAKARLNADKL